MYSLILSGKALKYTARSAAFRCLCGSRSKYYTEVVSYSIKPVFASIVLISLCICIPLSFKLISRFSNPVKLSNSPSAVSTTPTLGMIDSVMMKHLFAPYFYHVIL